MVIGGQTLSFLLTLLATPVFYSLFDDGTILAVRLRNGLSKGLSRLSLRRRK